MYSILANATTSGSGGMLGMILWLVIIFAFMYFLMIRPQSKEKKRMTAMLSSLEIGDSVLTTSGFFGVVIDINDEADAVVVEFGNNKNCRITMKKGAISEIEKPGAETAESK